MKFFHSSFFRSSIFAALVVAFAFFLSACQSKTTIAPDAPREMFGKLEYTGATYAVFHSPAPYKYALYDINGGFVAYVDTSKLVMSDIGSLSGKYVYVRGTLLKIEGNSVFKAEQLRLGRL